MKTGNTTKGLAITATLAIGLFLATSCESNNNNTKNTEDSKEVAEDRNEDKFNNNDQEKDAQFLVNASEISLEEIQLGQLAQQNSRMNDVKELGKMMEDQHNKSLSELTALASKKSITIPTTLTDNAVDTYTKLSKKAGTDFDKEYCDKMVKGHKDAIELFEKASKDANDAEIREWATATLPTLRKHLDHAVSCQEKCKKQSPNS